MIPPFCDIVASTKSILDRMGFSCEHDDTHGAVYVRSDGHRIIISIERYGDDYSVTFEKVISGRSERYVAIFLMEAIAPDIADKAISTSIQHGKTLKGHLQWWTIFLSFLETYSSVVFACPMQEPYKSRYQEICDKKLMESGLNGKT